MKKWLIAGLFLLLGAGCSLRVDETPTPGVQPPPPVSTLGDECTGPDDRTSCAQGQECVQECGPPVVRENDPPPKWSCQPIGKQRICPICLAANAEIDTPDGPVGVQSIRIGTRVWSLDAAGNKVASMVTAVSRMAAPASHWVVDLKLDDGREVWVSADHPTVDGRLVGDLRNGDRYDGARVADQQRVPYWDEATYDLLPDSPTGAYWANGILLGSTLNAPR